MSDTRELHDSAMDLFEEALLAARAGDSEKSRRLFSMALDKEAAAADSVAAEYTLEPTRSILHRSAASIALRIGDVQQAKQLVAAGLAGSAPAEIRREMEVLREQILVFEAATTDYRLRAPRGMTRIERISRQFRSAAPVNIVGLANAMAWQCGKQFWGRMSPVRYSLIYIEVALAGLPSE